MKEFILALALCLLVLPVMADLQPGKECSDCPEEAPCGYSVPSGDGCNTCYGSAWCIDGKWYTNGLSMCTAAACIRTYEISNPFK